MEEKFLKLLEEFGENTIYNNIVFLGLKDPPYADNPADELMDCSDIFLSKFRNTENSDYLRISKILRRAAHAIFRQKGGSSNKFIAAV